MSQEEIFGVFQSLYSHLNGRETQTLQRHELVLLTADEYFEVFAREVINEILELEGKKRVKFDQIAEKLALDPSVRFNLESDSRGLLKGNKVSVVLRAKKHFGKLWDTLADTEQAKILTGILDSDDEKALVDSLVKDCGLVVENAENVSKCSLPDGYSRLSLKAIAAMLPFLEAEVESYDKAAIKAGYNHSNLY